MNIFVIISTQKRQMKPLKGEMLMSNTIQIKQSGRYYEKFNRALSVALFTSVFGWLAMVNFFIKNTFIFSALFFTICYTGLLIYVLVLKRAISEDANKKTMVEYDTAGIYINSVDEWWIPWQDIKSFHIKEQKHLFSTDIRFYIQFKNKAISYWDNLMYTDKDHSIYFEFTLVNKEADALKEQLKLLEENYELNYFAFSSLDLGMYIFLNEKCKLSSEQMNKVMVDAISTYLYKNLFKIQAEDFYKELKINTLFDIYMNTTQNKYIYFCSDTQIIELSNIDGIPIYINHPSNNEIACVNLGIYNKMDDTLPEWVKQIAS